MSTLTWRVTPKRVLRSEWHKLWTVRSTWITLALTSALTIGIGLAIAATAEATGRMTKSRAHTGAHV
jgi:ABC-2 type transport system permease protein